MSTIEERAKNARNNLGYAGLEDVRDEFVHKTSWGDLIDDIESAYIKGATEQKKIDIERFLKWFRKRFQDCAEIEWINENCIDFQKSMAN